MQHVKGVMEIWTLLTTTCNSLDRFCYAVGGHQAWNIHVRNVRSLGHFWKL